MTRLIAALALLCSFVTPALSQGTQRSECLAMAGIPRAVPVNHRLAAKAEAVLYVVRVVPPLAKASMRRNAIRTCRPRPTEPSAAGRAAPNHLQNARAARPVKAANCSAQRGRQWVTGCASVA